jgi:TolA-binding protein
VSGTAGGAVASGSAVVGGKLAAALGAKAGALLVTKWVLVGALGAGAVGGAIWAADRSAPRNAPPPPAALVAAPAHSESKPAAAPQVVAAPAVVTAAAVEPPAAADHKSTKPVRVNALAAEPPLLQVARAELRAGNLDAASDALQHLRRRFPRGVLNQERDVLRIELAAARGDDASARRLAARFLRAYPESPHAAQLRPLAAAP